jgi:hypothetical protein
VRGVRSTLWEFRDLFFELRDGPAAGWGGEVLQPWLDMRPHLVAELHELGSPDSCRARVPRGGDHYPVLEGLYALSRVADVLVARAGVAIRAGAHHVDGDTAARQGP